jgi:hypothetical protein
MSPLPTSGRDLRAVVRAADALTTQVRRIADALETPVVEHVAVADDDATTPATTCSARHQGVLGVWRECIRAAHHTEDHSDGTGFHWTEAVAVYPVAPAVQKIAQHVPVEAYTAWTDQAPAAAEPRPARVVKHSGPMSEQRFEEMRENAEHLTGWIDEQVAKTRAADEDALRATRRESARIILDRATRGIALRSDESALLRQHFDAETREHDTARAVAAGNKRHVQTIVPEIDRLTAELGDYERRGEQLEELLRVAHETSNRSETERAAAVKRAEQADAVTAETKRLLERRTTTLRERAERAEAAIERVRALLPRDPREDEQIVPVSYPQLRTALDGTEQPTTEQPCKTCGHPADWHDPYEGCVGPNGIGGIGSDDCPCTPPEQPDA